MEAHLFDNDANMLIYVMGGHDIKFQAFRFLQKIIAPIAIGSEIS